MKKLLLSTTIVLLMTNLSYSQISLKKIVYDGEIGFFGNEIAMDSIFNKYKQFEILQVNYDSLLLRHNVTLSKVELLTTERNYYKTDNDNLQLQLSTYDKIVETKDEILKATVEDYKIKVRRYFLFGAGAGAIITLLLVLL